MSGERTQALVRLRREISTLSACPECGQLHVKKIDDEPQEELWSDEMIKVLGTDGAGKFGKLLDQVADRV